MTSMHSLRVCARDTRMIRDWWYIRHPKEGERERDAITEDIYNLEFIVKYANSVVVLRPC